MHRFQELVCEYLEGRIIIQPSVIALKIKVDDINKELTMMYGIH
jgi:hypothetical protein